MDLIPDWIKQYLVDRLQSNYFGKVTLHIEGGKVTVIREEKTVKPPKQ